MRVTIISDASHCQRRAAGHKPRPRLVERERIGTPIPFRDVLIEMAKS